MSELDIEGAGGKCGESSPEERVRRSVMQHMTPDNWALVADAKAAEIALAQQAPAVKLAFDAVNAYGRRLWRAHAAGDSRAVETWRALGQQAALICDVHEGHMLAVDGVRRMALRAGVWD